MIHSTMVEGRQRHGNRQIRLDLLNGMRITALATVADESRTMLLSGLAIARTNGVSVISALPSALFSALMFFCLRRGLDGLGMLETNCATCHQLAALLLGIEGRQHLAKRRLCIGFDDDPPRPDRDAHR
jgi:hypothetical protein